MHIWQRRAIIAIVVGVVFTIVFDWRLGLTLAVVAAIGDTIWQSRRVASTAPGVKLSRAEIRTHKQLSRLEKAGYKTLNSRRIPASEDQIDHLVIGPGGVFAIDSESWDRRLPVRTKNAKQLWHGPFSMKERLEHAQWEADQASELLGGVIGHKVTVRPRWPSTGPKIPWDVMTIRDVDVFSGPRLRKYLRRHERISGEPPLTETEVDRVYKAAHHAFPHPASPRSPGRLITRKAARETRTVREGRSACRRSVTHGYAR